MASPAPTSPPHLTRAARDHLRRRPNDQSRRRWQPGSGRPGALADSRFRAPLDPLAARPHRERDAVSGASGQRPARDASGGPRRAVSPSSRRVQEVRRGERRPHWQETRIGTPTAAVTALALSPHVRSDRTLLMASEDGVLLSRDGGESFALWSDDLRVPLVTALAVASLSDGGLDAYALGLGGTLWRRRL